LNISGLPEETATALSPLWEDILYICSVRYKEVPYPRLEAVVEALRAKKAENLVVLDVQSIAYPLCDYFVIATAESDRQAQAMADAILEAVQKQEGRLPAYRLEGYEYGHWVLVDLGDMVIHILQPEARAYYRLDELWGDARTLLASHA
jgi:ribosome-associated protein